MWINPSPNAANLNMARAYAGTVMLEGHDLERGQGHDPAAGDVRRAGHRGPGGDARNGAARARVARGLHAARNLVRADLPQACRPTVQRRAHPRRRPLLRSCGIPPWRLQALAFKAIRSLQPDYDLWRDFPYEYVFDKLAIDVINGGPALREWVDDPAAAAGDLEALASADEAAWANAKAPLRLY